MSLLNKIIAAITLLTLLSWQSFGQEGEIVVATEETSDSEDKKYTYFNIDEYEQKTIFKVNLNPNGAGIYGFDSRLFALLGVERKITPAWSIELRGMFPDGADISHNPRIGTELRFYPQKRRGAKASKFQVNNFSGNYFGLPVDYLHYGENRRDIPNLTVFTLRYGRQQKWGKWGFVDLSGAISYHNFNGINVIGLGIIADGGLAYGKSSPTSLTGQLDPKRSIEADWKRTVFGLGSPGFFLNDNSLSIYAMPYIEMPIGRYLTVRPFADFTYRRSPSTSPNDFYFFSIDASVHVRKYIGVRKREQKGKVDAGFNGFYTGLGFTNIYNYSDRLSRGESRKDSSFGFNPSLLAGWQKNAGQSIQFDFTTSLIYDPFDGNTISLGIMGQIGVVIGGKSKK